MSHISRCSAGMLAASLLLGCATLKEAFTDLAADHVQCGPLDEDRLCTPLTDLVVNIVNLEAGYNQQDDDWNTQRLRQRGFPAVPKRSGTFEARSFSGFFVGPGFDDHTYFAAIADHGTGNQWGISHSYKLHPAHRASIDAEFVEGQNVTLFRSTEDAQVQPLLLYDEHIATSKIQPALLQALGEQKKHPDGGLYLLAVDAGDRFNHRKVTIHLSQVLELFPYSSKDVREVPVRRIIVNPNDVVLAGSSSGPMFAARRILQHDGSVSDYEILCEHGNPIPVGFANKERADGESEDPSVRGKIEYIAAQALAGNPLKIEYYTVPFVHRMLARSSILFREMIGEPQWCSGLSQHYVLK